MNQHARIALGAAAVLAAFALGVVTGGEHTDGEHTDGAGHPALSVRPEPPTAIPSKGMYLVGPNGFPPGRYRTEGPRGSFCHWERLANTTGELRAIVASGVPTGPATVTVRAGELFNTSGCAEWRPA